MSEQFEPVRLTAVAQVAIRCDVCQQRYGRAPILAFVEWNRRGRLYVAVVIRRSRHIGMINAQRKAGVPRAAKRFDWEPVTASWAQLACRDCMHRPRVGRAKLVELAEQALAAGRRDAYA